jgi:hypothetical protein
MRRWFLSYNSQDAGIAEAGARIDHRGAGVPDLEIGA